MALCSVCHVSNLGLGGVPLTRVDGVWYCKSCLKKEKGVIKCSACGSEAFATNDHFQTINGKLMCTSCMTKAGLEDKILPIFLPGKAAAPSPSATSGAGSTGTNLVEDLTGGLKKALDETLSPGEKILACLNGSAGEALVATGHRVLILKAGMAAGSLSAYKAKSYFYDAITGVDCKTDMIYGLFQLQAAGTKVHDVKSVTAAKQADNAVTYLAAAGPRFEGVTKQIAQRLGKAARAGS
ncbi:MAG: hypothetical protein M1553_07575 [Firmicutes bacterium]|nr:hypothetical protein [Bacillota bacterium]